MWRRLVLRSDLTLDRVHRVLQSAFGWTDSHLHRVDTTEPFGRTGPAILTPFDMEKGDEGVPAAEVRLDQLVRESGDVAWYTYDFGDGWEHRIRVESTARREDDAPDAACTGGRRAGPLEDVGGPSGHNELVAAWTQDPALPTLEDFRRDWVPRGYDPVTFDVAETDAAVARTAVTPTAAVPGPLLPLLRPADEDLRRDLAELTERVRAGDGDGEPLDTAGGGAPSSSTRRPS